MAATAETEPRLSVENVQRVRDHIATIKPKRFNMGSYFGVWEGKWVEDVSPQPTDTNGKMLEGSCGTCACIAGHALVALAPEEKTPPRARLIMERAADLLGISSDASGRLFEPCNNDGWFQRKGPSLSKVTRAQALAVLDHLIATGEVSWQAAIEKAA